MISLLRPPTSSNRINGLDTLRAAAILLVLMSHYSVVVSHKETFGFLTAIGWEGVDLFFVLSGYLIGNQILSPISRGEAFSLKVFFARRLLRTLPNYYVILAVYLLLPDTLGGSATASLWRFLTFTQNIGLHFGETFSHSWSLCVEEQFYLILPVTVLLIAGLTKSIRMGWLAIALAVSMGIAIRGYSWMHNGHNLMSPLDYATHIYYSSFGRFDELLFGVAMAMLKNFHPDTYRKMQGKGNTLLVIGLLAVGVMSYLMLEYLNIDDYGYGFLATTFGYSALAASFAILTMSALSPTSLLNRIRLPGAEQIALWSYAIYLAHKPIFKLIIAPLAAWHIDTDAPLGIVIIMLAGITGGWLLYRLVENPFMALRQRWFPANRLPSITTSTRPAYT